MLINHEHFIKQFQSLLFKDLSSNSEAYIKNFVESKVACVEEEKMMVNQSKAAIERCHVFFAYSEEYDEEGRLVLFKILSRFYDKYLDTVRKKWNNLSNRDSVRFTVESFRRSSRASKN